MSPQVQTVRVTEELFVPDLEFKKFLGLKQDDIILTIVRKVGFFKKAQLDLCGTLITVSRKPQ